MSVSKLDPTWNGCLKNPVKFLSTSDGAGWNGARFVEFLSPAENEVDITHTQVCIQRFLRPANLFFAGATRPSPLLAGVQIAAHGAREKATIRGQMRGQFLFIDDALIEKWLPALLPDSPGALPAIPTGPAANSEVIEKLLDCLQVALLPGNDIANDHAFLDSVLRAIVRCLGDTCTRSLARSSGSRWLKVYELLERADLQDLNVNAMADAANVSARHFGRLFKNAHHCTPHQYLLQYRLSAARQALADPSLSLAQIALACGFSDQSQFSQAFKKHFGLSPLKIRLQLING